MGLGSEAFAWAKAEQEASGCMLHERKFIGPREFFMRDDAHTAFFHEEGAEHALCRTYWYDGRLAYYKVVNFGDLMEDSPDLMGMLLESGDYIYQKAAGGAGRAKIMNLEFFR